MPLSGLLRRFAPRNDAERAGKTSGHAFALPRRIPPAFIHALYDDLDRLPRADKRGLSMAAIDNADISAAFCHRASLPAPPPVASPERQPTDASVRSRSRRDRPAGRADRRHRPAGVNSGAPSTTCKPPRLQQWLHDAVREKSGAAVVEHMMQAEPSDIGGQRRASEVRKERAVTGIELRPPVDIDIALLRLRRALRIGRYQNRAAPRTTARPSARDGFAACTSRRCRCGLRPAPA